MASILRPVASLRLEVEKIPGDEHTAHATSEKKKSTITTLQSDSDIPSFVQLKPETNLNKPPPNWLVEDKRLVSHGSSSPSKPLVVSAPADSPVPAVPEELSSTELVFYSGGEVDVVAPVENLKKVFKMPFSDDKVSMAVHRIGNTLVLDGMFDEPQAPPAAGQPKKKSKAKTVEKALFSKFLYYSVSSENDPTRPSKEFELSLSGSDAVDAEESKVGHVIEEVHKPSELVGHSTPAKNQSTATSKPSKDKNNNKSAAVRTGGSGVPTAPAAQSAATAKTGQSTEKDKEGHESLLPKPPKAFRRVFRWQFRDLNMLLGSDLLIFRSKDHPAVSLQLRDVDREITAATCLDYWLDNVMANVPELAICFHKEGVVQGYKLMKTEDIPNLRPQFAFDPTIVEEHAHSLLHWLHDHCSNDAGTYVLHKEANDKTIRLYDVSDLRSVQDGTAQPTHSQHRSPFSFSVAMLCFRMAERLATAADGNGGVQTLEDNQRCRNLLAKCSELIDKEVYPRVAALAHERLADTYLASIDPGPTIITAEQSRADYIDAASHLSAGMQTLREEYPHACPTQSMSTEERESIVRRMEDKAVQCYLRLARVDMLNDKLGSALCWVYHASKHLPPSRDHMRLGEVLVSLGDVHYKLPRVVQKDKLSEHEEDMGPLEDPLPADSVMAGVRPLTLDLEPNYVRCLGYYLRAAQIITPAADTERHKSIMRKASSIRNDLGQHYLKHFRFTKAHECFQAALDGFRDVDDVTNMAFVHYNLAELYRQKARYVRARPVDASSSPTDATSPDLGIGLSPPFDKKKRADEAHALGAILPEEDSWFGRAVEAYKAAVDTLKERSRNPQMWTTAHLNMASTHMEVGLLIYRNSKAIYRINTEGSTAGLAPSGLTPAIVHALEKSITEKFFAAAKIYEDHRPESVPTVDYYLGNAYAWAAVSADALGASLDSRGKNPRAVLAEKYYHKALTRFKPLGFPSEFMRVHKQIAKMHLRLQSGSRSKNLEIALENILASREALSSRQAANGKQLALIPRPAGQQAPAPSTSATPPPTDLQSAAVQHVSQKLKTLMCDAMKEYIKLLTQEHAKAKPAAAAAAASKIENAKSVFRKALTESDFFVALQALGSLLGR